MKRFSGRESQATLCSAFWLRTTWTVWRYLYPISTVYPLSFSSVEWVIPFFLNYFNPKEKFQFMNSFRKRNVAPPGVVLINDRDSWLIMLFSIAWEKKGHFHDRDIQVGSAVVGSCTWLAHKDTMKVITTHVSSFPLYSQYGL